MTTDEFVKKANEIIALTFGLAKWIEFVDKHIKG